MQQRRLGRDDWPAAAALVTSAFHCAYRQLLTPAALERMEPDYLLAAWAGDPASQLIGLLADDALAAVCRVGVDPERPHRGHVFSVYVDPSQQGRGLGRHLLTVATDALKRAGFTEATLWVFADNERANGLYAQTGWIPTGRERVEADWGAREIELHRELGRA